MNEASNILTDQLGRKHTYLRISLTELCNLRCNYCMPEEGISLSPRSHIMNFNEIEKLATLFVKHGVTKIRLTGGEPLVRRDIDQLILRLGELPVELCLTTNAVLVHRFIDTFRKAGISKINVSLDTLQEDRFKSITRRDQFRQVWDNIQLLIAEGFRVKLNAVLMKGVNDDEIADFINLTRELPIAVRFIEFMPFDGNSWDRSKLVSSAEIMEAAAGAFTTNEISRLEDEAHDTSRNYRIQGFKGSFAIISTVTNPFCDSCNRLRLTANGRIKNCLFSGSETDLLSALREGKPLEDLIKSAVNAKLPSRGGMDTLQKFSDPELHSQNRSMIAIGG